MKLAFVIGCGTYDDPNISRLHFASNDATDFAASLRSAAGFQESEIRLLADDGQNAPQAPTKPRIVTQLTRGADSSPGLDLVVFFFSGHGFHSNHSGEDYLMPRDAVWADLDYTSIAFSKVAHYLKKWPAQRILVFTDACRAVVAGGRNVTIENWSPIDVRRLSAAGMACFASCTPGERSFEDERIQGGIFTHCLKEALSEKGRCKTVYELDSYLSKSMPLTSTALGKPQQHPFTKVEPLEILTFVIVSDQKVREWEAGLHAGIELRAQRTPASADLPLRDRDRAYCALDFGTTYSTIGYYDPSTGPRFIPSPQGKFLVPSVVSFSANLDYVVGWDALERARASPLTTLFHVKRYLGSNKIYNVLGRSLRAEAVAGLIIAHLRQNAEDHLGREVSEAVLSAPANFTIAQSNALLRACEIAKLKVSRIIAEPCAAAMIAKELFQLAQSENGRLIVLDLGGGTFDVAVLEYGDGVIEIKAVAGDNLLGGLDFDDALFSYVLDQLSKNRGLDSASVFSDADLERLRFECERAKIALGSRHETSVILQNIEIPGRGSVDFDVLITREHFREATRALNLRIRELISFCLKRAQTSPTELASVILAGQGCKIFAIQELLEHLFLMVPIVTRYQEFAVGYGLSKYSGVFAGDEKDLLLLDANYTTLELRCHSLRKKKRGSDELDGAISGQRENNTSRLILIAEGTTLPTRYGFRMSVTDLRDGIVFLDIVERGNSGFGEEVLVAHLPVEISKEDIIDIVVDCDVSRTFVVSCLVPSEKKVRTLFS